MVVQSRGKLQFLLVCGLVCLGFQFLFGVFSMLVDHVQAIWPAFLTHTDTMTVRGAQASLENYSVQSMVAAATSFVLIAIAFLISKHGKHLSVAGLLFIISGAANSVILFSTGLFAGVVLIAVGLLQIVKQRHLHEQRVRD